jgi:general secretion pathway protein D
VQAALHLLDTYGNTKVIANPHIAALDNQKATIKAGNRIPVNQQTIVGNVSNAGDDDVAVHRHRRSAAGDAAHQRWRAGDAGRAGRSQQPRNAGRAGGALRRSTRAPVQTLLSVRPGQTMVMGGLIQETKGNANKGCRF